MTINCKNCKTTFEGNYCNKCGQTANTHEINFHSILHEVQHTFLHIDKGILYTTKQLLIRPGHTIRDYLNGKRVEHFKPFSYILILSTVYALLTKASQKVTIIEEFFKGFSEGTSRETNANASAFTSSIQWLQHHYAYTTLLTIPIVSLASYWAFKKCKYNYFQHLIINSYTAGQRTVVFLCLLPFDYLLSNKASSTGFEFFKIAIVLTLNLWVYFQFFNNIKPIKRILLSFLTAILLTILFLLALTLFFIIAKVMQ
jgi:Protein of unknown function (DUF3667)